MFVQTQYPIYDIEALTYIRRDPLTRMEGLGIYNVSLIHFYIPQGNLYHRSYTSLLSQCAATGSGRVHFPIHQFTFDFLRLSSSTVQMPTSEVPLHMPSFSPTCHSIPNFSASRRKFRHTYDCRDDQEGPLPGPNSLADAPRATCTSPLQHKPGHGLPCSVS